MATLPPDKVKLTDSDTKTEWPSYSCIHLVVGCPSALRSSLCRNEEALAKHNEQEAVREWGTWSALGSGRDSRDEKDEGGDASITLAI